MSASEAPAAVRASEVAVDPDRPLLIVDVDEVLAFFLAGFDAYLNERGFELRMTRFACSRTSTRSAARR
jgi:hypothetical protein